MSLKTYVNILKDAEDIKDFKYLTKETFGDFFNTATVKTVAAVTATYALAKAIQAVSDKYNLSYDSSIKNTKQRRKT